MLTCSFFFLVHGACWAEAQQALNAAIAAADRTDPGWRYDALHAARPKLADKDNGALQVLAAAKAMPKPWQPFAKTLKFPNERKIAAGERLELVQEFERRLFDREAPMVLNPQEIAAVEAEVK